MYKLYCSMLLIVLSFPSYAISLTQAQQVYNKLTGSSKPRLIYENANYINAWATGNSIHITRGMLAYLRSKDEVAVVLGHELGHYRMGHAQSTHAHEYSADRYGVNLARSKGFNVCRGVQEILRFHDKASRTHPSSIDRYNRVKCKGAV